MAFDKTARAFVEKAKEEIGHLEGGGLIMVGNAFSSVIILKGQRGEAEREDGALLSGKDGEALRAALAKLGYAPEDWCALACWRSDGGFLAPAQLRLALATLDPATVIATDDAAARLVCDAYADESCSLELGRPGVVCGMRVLALGGFEDALGSMRSKQVMWARLKRIPPLGDPY